MLISGLIKTGEGEGGGGGRVELGVGNFFQKR